MSVMVSSQYVNYRQLLIFGVEAQPALVQQQIELLAVVKAEVEDRDIKITVVRGATQLNKKYDIKPGSFTIILVGKDGGEKHRSASIMQPKQLFTIIDAMPMRQSEMRKND